MGAPRPPPPAGQLRAWLTRGRVREVRDLCCSWLGLWGSRSAGEKPWVGTCSPGLHLGGPVRRSQRPAAAPLGDGQVPSWRAASRVPPHPVRSQHPQESYGPGHQAPAAGYPSASLPPFHGQQRGPRNRGLLHVTRPWWPMINSAAEHLPPQGPRELFPMGLAGPRSRALSSPGGHAPGPALGGSSPRLPSVQRAARDRAPPGEKPRAPRSRQMGAPSVPPTARVSPRHVPTVGSAGQVAVTSHQLS